MGLRSAKAVRGSRRGQRCVRYLCHSSCNSTASPLSRQMGARVVGGSHCCNGLAPWATAGVSGLPCHLQRRRDQSARYCLGCGPGGCRLRRSTGAQRLLPLVWRRLQSFPRAIVLYHSRKGAVSDQKFDPMSNRLYVPS
jgi:hypothetical protein